MTGRSASWLVREIARGAHGNCAMLDLLEIAMEGRKTWTKNEWQVLLTRLDTCDLTVAQFQASLKDWI